MLRPEDVLAARLLFAKMPHSRDVLVERVDALRRDPGSAKLLPVLHEDGIITRQQASYVHAAVERYKHERGMRVYAQLLLEAGVPLERLQGFVNRLQGAGSMAVLGASLTEAGLVPLEREQQLRAEAGQVFELALQSLVQGVAAGGQPAGEEPGRFQRSTTRKYLERAEGLGADEVAAAKADTRKLSPPEILDPLASVREQAPTRPKTLKLPSATEALLRTKLHVHVEGHSGEPFEVPSWVDTTDPRRGQRVKDYEILGQVGVGSMGIVYLAKQDGRPDRPVALKVLPPDADDEAKARFKREILANSFFSHSGALEIYDAGESEEGEHFLAMEFFDGRDLGRVLEVEGRLSPSEALRIGLQTLETLTAAHDAALVHRDVKPDNILVSDDRTTSKLLDFGLALIGDLGNFRSQVFETRKFGITGTPRYLSPEQAAEDELGPPSDLYSLGVVLYEMLSGRLPFTAKSPKGFVMAHMTKPPLPLRQANPDLGALPPALCSLVDRLLEKEPEDRPSGSQVATTLRQLIATLG